MTLPAGENRGSQVHDEYADDAVAEPAGRGAEESPLSEAARINAGCRLSDEFLEEPGSWSVPAPILWTIKARRHLRGNVGVRQPCGPGNPPAPPDGPLEARARIERLLARTFPGVAVVVQDQMFGFRRNPDLHVLLVEVCGDEERAGSYVVKVGPVEELEPELRGWMDCRPDGLRHDLVLLPLEAGVREDRPGCDGRTWMSLVYGDAQQFIGVENTTSLESAALQAVRFGVPTVPSVREVLVQLYERVGHLLYGVSEEDDPRRPGFSLEVRHLEDSLDRWDRQPHLRAVRTDLDGLLQRLDRPGGGVPAQCYLDPVDYLRYILEVVHQGQVGAAFPDPDYPAPAPADVVPGMLRGYAHGDLHGRNVLVGVVRERVLWPTVFDYEHMGPGNLVGWDFCKLETELKVRAYDAIFLRQEGPFVRRVQDFERRLAELTEDHHQHGTWPAPGVAGDTPEERLRMLLLEIRHLASVHLGSNRGRPRRWLEEYYFLLMTYGVTAGRFENLHRRELLAALVSAGVAASRLTWPRVRYLQERRRLGLDAPPAGQ